VAAAADAESGISKRVLHPQASSAHPTRCKRLPKAGRAALRGPRRFWRRGRKAKVYCSGQSEAGWAATRSTAGKTVMDCGLESYAATGGPRYVPIEPDVNDSDALAASIFGLI